MDRIDVEQAAHQGRLKFDELVKRYTIDHNEFVLAVKDLATAFEEICDKGRKFDEQAGEIWATAKNIAGAEISMGHVPGGGSWAKGPGSFNANSVLLQSVAEQVLINADVNLHLISLSADYGPEARALVNLLGQFCGIRLASKKSNGRGPYDGKVLIQDHDGGHYWG